jgi:hypothetical protein
MVHDDAEKRVRIARQAQASLLAKTVSRPGLSSTMTRNEIVVVAYYWPSSSA